MLDRYIAAALQRATCEYLDDDEIYYCEVPDLPGVWSSGDSPDDARDELRTVISDWVQLGLKLNHPIPIVDGIDLNSQTIQHG